MKEENCVMNECVCEKAEIENTPLKTFVVTVQADNRNKSKPRVLYQYAEMVIYAPDIRSACDVAEEQFSDYDSVEITKAQLANENGKQQDKDA